MLRISKYIKINTNENCGDEGWKDWKWEGKIADQMSKAG